jgi:tetratricopeptide (TPR) repeat protein
VLTRGLAASERVPLLAPPLAADLGVACSRLGEVQKGLQHLNAAVEGARAMGRLSRLPLILVKCAEIHLLAGEVERAASLGASALSLALEQKERGNEVYARLLLADVYARSEPKPQTAEARHYYRVAIDKAAALSMRPLGARAHAGLGTLLMLEDEPTEAREHVAIALAMYRDMGMTFWSERLQSAATAAGLVHERSG